MARRRAKATKPATKSKSQAKPKPAPKSSISKPPASKKRPSPDSTAKSTIPYTSLAARKRRQPSCSMASLRNLETEETIEENFIGLFSSRSDNHYTWGKTEAKPIAAIRRKGGKGPRLSMRQLAGLPRGLFPFIIEDSPEPTIPNSPDRSPLLRLSFEIREMIYGYLLIYRRPIIVQYDWEIVEHRFFNKNNGVIYVCKQINIEATTFLYKNNAFRTILRPPPSTFFYRDTYTIQTKFLPLFKNVIITFERDNYNVDWFDKACASVKKLVDADVSLDSLTLVTFPQRVGMSDTAVGMEAHPITFADFFYEKGEFMAELKKLKYQVLNVVVKKAEKAEKADDEDIKWRLLISLNLRDLHLGATEVDKLANAETIKMARARVKVIESQLLELKERFEDVFEDDEQAMIDGKFRLLDEDETYDDGLALAVGTQVFGFPA